MSLHIKKKIAKEVRETGLAGKVDNISIQRLADYAETEHGGDMQIVVDILLLCQQDRFQGDKISLDVIERAIAKRMESVQAVELLEVIGAFQVPKISYDQVGRKLYTDRKPRCLMGVAEHKHAMYLDRLLLVQQRLRRNPTFQQANLILPGSGGAHTAHLTDVQSLKGVVGVNRYVLGVVSRGEDGKFRLEDSGGAVPLNLKLTETAGGFFTENCIVIVEGCLGHDGVFHAKAMGLPPCELRSELPIAARRLNFFGGAELSNEQLFELSEAEDNHGESRVVVLANVWLDKPEVLKGLADVLKGYAAAATPPAMFVLMGNFHSRASEGGGGGGAGPVDFLAMRECFDTLAHMIDLEPRIKEHCRFVFVPGPGDPSPGSILPQPPLPAFLTAKLREVLPSATFTTNPCRLRFLGQQLVFFRYDLLKRLRRRAIVPAKREHLCAHCIRSPWSQGCSCKGATAKEAESPPEGSDPTAFMWAQATCTVLEQSHLCPLPLLQQPIYWQADHALALYPLPHTLVLADDSPQAQHEKSGCNMVNPGSFADRMFTALLPCAPSASKRVEMCELPRPGGPTQTQQESEDEEEAGLEPEQQQAAAQHSEPDDEDIEDMAATDEADAAKAAGVAAEEADWQAMIVEAAAYQRHRPTPSFASRGGTGSADPLAQQPQDGVKSEPGGGADESQEDRQPSMLPRNRSDSQRRNRTQQAGTQGASAQGVVGGSDQLGWEHEFSQEEELEQEGLDEADREDGSESPVEDGGQQGNGRRVAGRGRRPKGTQVTQEEAAWLGMEGRRGSGDGGEEEGAGGSDSEEENGGGQNGGQPDPGSDAELESGGQAGPGSDSGSGRDREGLDEDGDTEDEGLAGDDEAEVDVVGGAVGVAGVDAVVSISVGPHAKVQQHASDEEMVDA
ncbi:MAG: hypothetical protein WDW36_006298 [Sanguina aurantia]